MEKNLAVLYVKGSHFCSKKARVLLDWIYAAIAPKCLGLVTWKILRAKILLKTTVQHLMKLASFWAVLLSSFGNILL